MRIGLRGDVPLHRRHPVALHAGVLERFPANLSGHPGMNAGDAVFDAVQYGAADPSGICMRWRMSRTQPPCVNRSHYPLSTASYPHFGTDTRP